MALHITDEETDRLVRERAQSRGIGITEAVRLAVKEKLDEVPVRERVRLIQDRIAEAIARNKPEPVTDWKAFYDNLEGETAVDR